MNIERNCQTCKYYKDGYGYCENLELRPCYPQIGCDDFSKRDELIIDEAIQRYKNDAEFERTHGNLQGYLEFSQLVKWLRKYQRITEIYQKFNEVNFSYDKAMRKIINVIESEETDATN